MKLRVGSWLLFPALLVAFACVTRVVVAQTNGESSGAEALLPPPVDAQKASGLSGKKLENMDGLPLGTVRDVALDLQSGHVRYVIVSTGGFVGIGAQLRAVPPQVVSGATAKRNTLSVEVTRDRWEESPTFRRGELDSLGELNRARQIYAYYGHRLFENGVQIAGANGQGADPAELPTPVGRATGERARNGEQSLKLASDVIGKDVVNRQQEIVGEVSDMLVDLSGQRVTFAIISAGRMFKDRDRIFAVPARALTLSSDGRRMVIDASRQQFEQARPFDNRAWQAAGLSGGIEIYLFEDGRLIPQPPSATPFDQSETRSDRQLTQQLRRALMQDDSLSLTAKNVKIVTRDGRIMLNGQVLSERERNSVQRWAEQLAGAQNVDNQLEIRRAR